MSFGLLLGKTLVRFLKLVENGLGTSEVTQTSRLGGWLRVEDIHVHYAWRLAVDFYLRHSYWMARPGLGLDGWIDRGIMDALPAESKTKL